ncbi:josephin-2-like [Ostrea edulis]|uniref:josephin-2-like n=1 Tax=Ostrea edulis TaxID=37623 RepID=UPI002094739C|nr:josephin-2-like [Ostrea edulis]
MGATYSCANKMSDDNEREVYHERQVKELCALHALNNLFQDQKAFSKKDLDEICVRLSPDHFINPHRSMLGLGNYDVNVLMAAIQTKKCETIWFDKRKNIKCLLPENIQGFILNTPSECKWGLLHFPFKRKHWIAVRKIEDIYYNLDSKLDSPEPIGDKESLFSFLHRELENGEKELLIVVSQDVECAGTWRRDSDSVTATVSNGNNVHDSTTSKAILQPLDDL